MYWIQNKAESSCEIMLYDLILGGYTAQRLIEQLKQSKGMKNITLRINSDGGDVFEGLAIYNYLKSLDAEITVYIDGIAASAASIVACAGRVVMPENAMMMIHNPWGMVQGDSEEIRALAEILDKTKASILSIYTGKTGKGSDELSALMDKESWMTAYEAEALGFCDEIIPAKEHEDNPEGAVLTEAVMSADDAVKAERARMQELDSLMTPERRGIIMKAKYETYQSAKDIALELLKIEQRRKDNEEAEGILPALRNTAEAVSEHITDIINRKRGYKNGR